MKINIFSIYNALPFVFETSDTISLHDFVCQRLFSYTFTEYNKNKLPLFILFFLLPAVSYLYFHFNVTILTPYILKQPH